MCAGSLTPSAGSSALCGGYSGVAGCGFMWRAQGRDCKFAAEKGKTGMNVSVFLI